MASRSLPGWPCEENPVAEIDMIPRSYRSAMRLRKSLRLFLAVFIALPVAGAGVSGVLKWRIAQGEMRLAQLRADSTVAQTGSAAIDAARTHNAMLSQAVVSLAALRGAGETVHIADAIDAALPPQVSFDQLSFSRDAQMLAPTGAAQGDLVLAAGPGNAGAESWQLAQRLEISGLAAGYPALTAFIGKLSAQPRLAQVRMVRSSGAGDPARVLLPASLVQADAGVRFTVIATVEPAR
jgi:Tfp pilus assembly protein PilN